ncbi:MAG: hypothetical protein AAF717_07330 [Bacteroidota bacterium]
MNLGKPIQFSKSIPRSTPNSFNAPDCLREAHGVHGNRELAGKHYKNHWYYILIPLKPYK